MAIKIRDSTGKTIKVAGKGPPGANGSPGNDGMSAYQYAVAGGYTGTEAEFQALMASGPWAPVLTGNRNLYVANTGSDSTGDGSQSRPFATIQTAINTLPKNLNGHFATIHAAAGTYAGFKIEGFYGGGRSNSPSISVLGEQNGGTVITGGIGVYSCELAIVLRYMEVSGIVDGTANVSVLSCGGTMTVFNCKLTDTAAPCGIWAANARVNIGSCEISNKTGAAVTMNGSIVFSSRISGSGNKECFHVGSSNALATALLIGYGNTIAGTTKYVRELGGVVFENGALVS